MLGASHPATQPDTEEERKKRFTKIGKGKSPEAKGGQNIVS